MLAQRYRLLRRIATGGMGTVHEAVDERLGRRVAVKILNPEYADEPDCVERFSREACAAAGLVHPHVAQIFDTGHDAAQYFIVMEYVDGDDLGHELSRRTRLLPARAVEIADQLCAALAAAHAVGIVHRDIKPSNVLLGSGDRVKLTDFGIAKACGQAALTATGLVLGSANYLSPEQADGQTATPASDLYSAGIVLFEMLTGTVPFTGPSPVAVAHDHLTREVPPVDGLVPGLPPTLAAVVGRATAKNPSDRFPDATAMQAELRNCGEATGEPSPRADLTAAPAAGPPALAVPQCGFGRLGSAAAIVATVLVAGGLALLNDQSSQQADAASPPNRTSVAAGASWQTDANSRVATQRRIGWPVNDPKKWDDHDKGRLGHRGHHYAKGHKPDENLPVHRGHHYAKGHKPGHGPSITLLHHSTSDDRMT